MTSTRPVILPLFCVALMLFVLLPVQSVFAQDSAKELLKYTPDKAGAVFGVNLEDARKSTFYKEGLGLLKTVPDFKKLLGEVEEELNLNLEKDIHSVVAVAPRPTNASKPDDAIVIIMSGKFDEEKILARAKEEEIKSRKVGKLTVYDSDDSEFALIGKDVVVISTGKETFRTAAFKAASKKSKSPSKSVKKLTKKLNTSKHLWFAADTSKAAKDAPGQPKEVAVTLDFTKGLKLDGVLRLSNEEEATKALADYEANKEQFEGGAALIGAPSFAKNFKLTSSKSTLSFSSSMPSKEVTSVARWAKGMMEAQR